MRPWDKSQSFFLILGGARAFFREYISLPPAFRPALAFGGYVYQLRTTFLELQADAACEQRLPASVPTAQATPVVRLPRLLSDAEIAQVEALHRSARGRLGTSGRDADQGSAAYRAGAWETSYVREPCPESPLHTYPRNPRNATR